MYLSIIMVYNKSWWRFPVFYVRHCKRYIDFDMSIYRIAKNRARVKLFIAKLQAKKKTELLKANKHHVYCSSKSKTQNKKNRDVANVKTHDEQNLKTTTQSQKNTFARLSHDYIIHQPRKHN